MNPTTCNECSIPPNFIIAELPQQNNNIIYGIKCRDCGDQWQEQEETTNN